ncbi:hypothetical protein JQC92_12270 [Shewanella sp. 202IG2-18]|uniref:hypothetical protein n=1 Tax=Parashewanella hymeniacidonis TaxID=2807618 RepID=UPI0019617C74|nr:hypothetical protein [Parashewanella hymeniacidonis]MBM7072797.1 hypothetical protein [Parashewanella hymeniacidonis]
MSNLKRGFLIINLCVLLTQSMLVTAAPIKMSLISMNVQAQMLQSIDCHQQDKAQHICCQQYGEKHLCNSECGQCFATSASANILMNIPLFDVNFDQESHFSYLTFFYHFSPDDGLRPPIA